MEPETAQIVVLSIIAVVGVFVLIYFIRKPESHHEDLARRNINIDMKISDERKNEMTKTITAYVKSIGSIADDHGLIRGGAITIKEDEVILVGKKRWPLITKVILLIIIVTLLITTIGVLPGVIGFLIIGAILDLACTKELTFSIQKSSISDLLRNGRRISFKAISAVGIEVKTIKVEFDVESDKAAECIEIELMQK